MWSSLKAVIRQQYTLFDEKAGASAENFTAEGGRTTCGRGCRNCCNLAVECTFTEALPVAWPTHYLAAPRDLAQEMEAAAAWRMLDTFGFTLSDNLPFLVWLEKEYRLSAVAAQGHASTLALFEKEGLNLPFLVSLHRQ